MGVMELWGEIRSEAYEWYCENKLFEDMESFRAVRIMVLKDALILVHHEC